MKRVFIAGATGYLGRYLVDEFRSNGWEVHALVRNADKAVKMGLAADTIIQGEATKPSDLVGKLAGVDLIISTLGITRQKDGLSYMDVDYQANANLLEEALSAGVERFCYIHVIHAERMKNVALVAAKQAFVDQLRAAPISSTVVAPSGYFSDMGDFMAMAKSGRIYLFGKGEHRLNPIHGADLASVIHTSVLEGKTEVMAGGPDVFTQTEIAHLAFAALRKKPRITYLPNGLIKLVLWTLTTYTPQKIYGPFQFFLTALQIDMEGACFGKHHLSEHFEELATTNS